MMSCTSQSGPIVFDIPATGKEIAEKWPEIRKNAQPCDKEPCGDSEFVLFKVKYPKFNLVFTGTKEETLEPATGYMNVCKEMDGEITDYNLFVWIGNDGYFHEDEFYHQSDSQELSDDDSFIGVSDTGLVIPSRQ